MSDAPKVFYDIILDYQPLKFIYEYGFDWDDRITKLLFQKSSQKPRELMNLLSDVTENAITTLWRYMMDSPAKRSQCSQIRPNIYRLTSNRWFLQLYACFGKYENSSADKQISNCANKEWAYPSCRDEVSSCPYQRPCAIKNELKIFSRLRDGSLKKADIKLTDELFLQVIEKEYADVIALTDGRYSFLENKWTEHAAVRSPSHPDALFTNKMEYQRFLEMVDFLSGFAPLSVLGDSFLRRLGSERPVLPVFVRNLPPEYGLEQEYIYRCLYAMSHRLSVCYENHLYHPLRLCYRDRGLDGLEETLYLIAQPQEAGQPGPLVWLPLRNGAYLAPSKRKGKTARETVHFPSGPAEESSLFDVTFFCHKDAGYLTDRRRNLWKSQIVESPGAGNAAPLPEECTFASPYHPELHHWTAEQVTYRVFKNDLPGFALFVRSFGDFARCPALDGTSIASRSNHVFAGNKKSPQKGSIQAYQSLLNLYRSNALLAGASSASAALPPKMEELSWLRFVLELYPNYCGLFLAEQTITRLKEYLVRCGAKLPLQEWYDYSSRVKDIPARTAEKYRGIFDAVRSREILRYEYQNRNVEIFPYALEYDVCRHLSGRVEEPINIMCYNLREKRNLMIRYRDIRYKNGIQQDDYCFSALDKIYHTLAYALRCTSQGIAVGWGDAKKLIQQIWPGKIRSWEKRIKALFEDNNQPEDYAVLLGRAKEAAGADEETLAFLERVFVHQMDERPFSNTGSKPALFRRKYQSLLLESFTEALRQGLERLSEPLAANRDDDIWRLICGSEDENGGVLCEIAFLNEHFLSERLSFTLRETDPALSDTVYRLFRSCVCAGELQKDGTLRFTVEYETFQYRRIHMALMALGDSVISIDQAETAKIIQARKENQSGGGDSI